MITKLIFKANVNKGNMEHDSLEAEYHIAPEFETVEEAFEEVKNQVYGLLGIDEKTRGVDKTRRPATKRPNKKA